MAKTRKTRPRKAKAKSGPRARAAALLSRWGRRLRGAALLAVVALLAWVGLYRWVDPPTTPYIRAEAARLGAVSRDWVDLGEVAPVMARAVVAAEDANFCRHWGFDVDAIRDAIEDGGTRGASTLSQQVVKNTFLWQGRSWVRKGLETALTPVMEAFWPKRRIVEIYLNVAEMGEGVFGVQAAARAHFGVDAADLTQAQAARLASILPNPRARDPNALSPALRRKAARVADGAATIRADGRAACFED